MTNDVKYDELLKQYTWSYEGIQFCWDEKPTDANVDTAKLLATNYHKNIDSILIRREVKALIKKYSIDQIKCG